MRNSTTVGAGFDEAGFVGTGFDAAGVGNYQLAAR
jgi:hypothetical protein